MKDYTPEEIGEMLDRNESFCGTQANFEKLRTYHGIRRGLEALQERCDCVLEADGYAPNTREQNVILWLDLSPAAILDREQAAALAAVMSQSDGVVITAMEDRTRISFAVKDIWNDRKDGTT